MYGLRFRIVLVLGLIALAVTAGVLYAECFTYEDSRIQIIEQEPTCAGSGRGCTECTGSGGSWCITNGISCDPGNGGGGGGIAY